MTHSTTQNTADAFNAEGLHTDTATNDFSIGAAIELACSSKAIATNMARMALAGYAVHQGCVGDFTVCRYDITKYCQNFAALQAFSRKVGASK